MKPIRAPRAARFRSLELYREDLDQLVAFFQKSCAAVTISDNTNSYESLDEMKTIVGSEIKVLNITSETPRVHFSLNRREYPPGSATPLIFNLLGTEEITDDAERLFLRVKEFLDEHQRPGNTRFVVLAFVGLGLACLLTAHAVVIALSGRGFHVTPAIVACMIFAVLFVILGVANSLNRLTLETRLNSPSLFRKYREEFAKHTIMALISGVIGLIFGWLLGHFLK